MLFTDLLQLKSLLEIDPNDFSEDKKLNIINRFATDWIGEFLNRPDFSYATRAEYYQGTGTQQLLLRNRPVYPMTGTPQQITVQVNEDGGFFGSASGSFDSNLTTLIYGRDYCLKIDTPIGTVSGVITDGVSRSGILYRINDFWNKPQVRQTGLLSPFIWTDLGSILVTYQAGYTIDTLPTSIRMAAVFLVSRLRYILPLGLELTSDAYEERSISTAGQAKNYLMSLVKPMLNMHRNWKF